MRVEGGIRWLVGRLRRDQSQRGSWEYPFETGVVADCYMIILLRTLEIDDEKFIRKLVERILSLQGRNGAWRVFYDEGEGNVNATLEAYYALLYSGLLDKGDERLVAARRFVVENGGIRKTHLFTKVVLAATGQMEWPRFFPFPLEVMLLPSSFPVNFYSFSVFGRANLAPLMILADRKFQARTERTPDLTDLAAREDGEIELFRDVDSWRGLGSFLKNGLKTLAGLPGEVHRLSTERAKNYMLNRVEKDGTLLGYFSSTFLMIFALLALGYRKDDPVILAAVRGLAGMRTVVDGHLHVQYTTASVWNTALASYALQEAGVPAGDPMVARANGYLLKKQHYRYGDWVVHNRDASPGGWGFADSNTIQPDVDDTTAALRAISWSVGGGDRAGRGSGAGQGARYGMEPGYGMHSGYGMGQELGQGSGMGSGYGMGLSNGMGTEIGQGLPVGQHLGYGQGTGYGANVNSGFMAGQNLGYGQGSIPGMPAGNNFTHSASVSGGEAQMTDYSGAWQRGVRWVLSMQNDDGGWPAFEKNTNSKLLTLVPVEKAEFLLTDPSSADLTGRTLEFLCNYTSLPKSDPAVKKGIRWLVQNQKKDGSWYGRWGICYIYGTWAAVTGLRAAGIFPSEKVLSRAAGWLKGIQNADGGWGESCFSDNAGKYVPLGASTLVHTAWAVDALIALAGRGRPTEEINSGVGYLLENLESTDWTEDYPEGQGLAGDFYIHYHSYRYIFPLLALAHYRAKFGE
ncbi:prenyltransferase/squalene oxidase repeat-containing protein [Neobacillus sp. YIM B06451]|uniref:terpene cyclase/mutase family protein n=1 Tax=Neobacillus sp. YIM B06451 TaxID=3070994 RepID=UPI00292CB5F3|nr:prenyltransferase/squalene oxidase repeat-containing protein [Neobacillus sp. YIM B06451]